MAMIPLPSSWLCVCRIYLRSRCDHILFSIVVGGGVVVVVVVILITLFLFFSDCKQIELNQYHYWGRIKKNNKKDFNRNGKLSETRKESDAYRIAYKCCCLQICFQFYFLNLVNNT